MIFLLPFDMSDEDRIRYIRDNLRLCHRDPLITDPKKKVSKIFVIISVSYHYFDYIKHSIIKYPALPILTVDESEVDDFKELFKAQCPSLWHRGEGGWGGDNETPHAAMFCLITMDYKYNTNYLLYFVNLCRKWRLN